MASDKKPPLTVDDLPTQGQPNGDVSKDAHKLVQEDVTRRHARTGDRNTDLRQGPGKKSS